MLLKYREFLCRSRGTTFDKRWQLRSSTLGAQLKSKLYRIKYFTLITRLFEIIPTDANPMTTTFAHDATSRVLLLRYHKCIAASAIRSVLRSNYGEHNVCARKSEVVHINMLRDEF